MIQAPVAVSWDDQGRMYVCEMRGYMHDVDGTGEDQPLGRISRLEDGDGDGVYDQATVFVDRLVMPRAVMALGDGALVGEPPQLRWYRDRDGDGVAETNDVVPVSFGSRGGQPEHMVNSPTWVMDNWIAMAGHSARVRFKAGQFMADNTPTRGQWGLTQDDWGRLFFNYNSDLLRGDMVPASYYARNPFLPKTVTALNVKVMGDQSTWPSHPTPGVNRGYSGGQLRPDGTLATGTADCGPGIYRGDLFPREFQGNAFIPEPTGNLVKRVILSETNGVVTARNAYSKTEFLTSTDERFRPVNALTGPDGALYIVDMARGIVQHKGFLTHYLIANIKDRKLESPVNLGRIWRVVPEGARPKAVKLPRETQGVVPYLAHPNGWVRDTAQRVLVERGDLSVTGAVKKVLADAALPQARAQALWTLEGLGALDPAVVASLFRDPDPHVRAAAVRLADRSLVPELIQLAGDPDASVRLQLGLRLSAEPGPDVQRTLLDVLKQGESPYVAEAIATGLRAREADFVEALLREPEAKNDPVAKSGILQLLAACVMKEHRSANVSRLLALAGAQPSGGARQLALLDGMAPKPQGKNPPPVKPVYLEAEPRDFAALKAKASGKLKTALATLDEVLLWPGKPGAPPPPVIRPLTPEQQAGFERGKLIYVSLCSACHQPSGTGLEGLAPPLVDSEWVLGSPDRPARIILNGLTGPVSVGGVTWRLEMPPLRQLADEDIAGVLTYIRREWDHNASPVSSNDITKIRAAVAARTTPWTSDELKKPFPAR